MLRIVLSQGSKAAKDYFTSALDPGDYYAKGDAPAPGRWGGNGATHLGLSGDVRRADFAALCDNRDPRSGEPLTPRTKAVRRAGYDINFHAPKSLSLLSVISGDARVEAAFRTAVEETMRLIEAQAQTRVRRNGAQDDRTTGCLVWATFIHDTTRPVRGVPDPHLHAHCFTPNLTFDSVEGRWKALQLYDVKRDAGFFEAAFHSRLAELIRELGYGIERRGKFWEIEGFSAGLLKKFSRRTAEIEALAAARSIDDPKARAALGAKTRRSKAAGIPRSRVIEDWRSRLSEEDRRTIQPKYAKKGTMPEDGAREAVAFALDVAFERASVVSEVQIVQEALRRGTGVTTLKRVRRELDLAKVIRRSILGRSFITSGAVLAEEDAVIAFARNGRGSCEPLGRRSVPLGHDGLSSEQRRLVEHVWGSTDQVTLVRGVAGTGKTTIIRASVDGLRSAGVPVVVLAPSAMASRGTLRAHGFDDADTVSRFLINGQLQAKAAKGVVWIDEAGLVGMRTLRKILEVVRDIDARLVLSGDGRQHAPIERGDSLRLLESQAGLRLEELTEIRRQRGMYKSAIEALSRGDTALGFSRLDEMGAIREVVDEKCRHEEVARSFIEARSRGLSAVVVSPTHAEGDRVTATIREQLRLRGSLGEEGMTVEAFRSKGLTIPERADVAGYAPGDVVQFHQHARDFRAGDRVRVSSVDVANRQVEVVENEMKLQLPLEAAARFDVFKGRPIALSRGDAIRVTRNGRTSDDASSVHNGTLHRVARFSESGDIILSDGRTLAREFGHLDYGYCLTSHAVQSSAVDKVIIAQSAESRGAASDAQFYVCASRGRREVVVFTDDKDELLQSVERPEGRLSANELLQASELETREREEQRRQKDMEVER